MKGNFCYKSMINLSLEVNHSIMCLLKSWFKIILCLPRGSFWGLGSLKDMCPILLTYTKNFCLVLLLNLASLKLFQMGSSGCWQIDGKVNFDKTQSKWTLRLDFDIGFVNRTFVFFSKVMLLKPYLRRHIFKNFKLRLFKV